MTLASPLSATLVELLLAFGKVLLHRQGRGGGVAHGGGDLPGQLLPQIARGVKAGNRGPHVRVGDQIACRVVIDMVADDPGIGLEADEYEDPTYGQLRLLAGS